MATGALVKKRKPSEEEEDKVLDAARNGDVEVIQELISSDVDVTRIVDKNLFQNTPLHYAAGKGHTETAAVLLKSGAAVNRKDKCQVTPLHDASSGGHTEAVALLLESGADVNVKNREQKTPLHYATNKGHTETVAFLLKSGANINIKDKFQRTPLYRAASEGHTETVDLLLKNGADINKKDYRNMTALEWAMKAGHRKTVDCFMKHLKMIDIEVQQKILKQLESERTHDSPDLRNLPSDIVIRYAIEWERLGLLLGLKEDDTAKISEHYAHHPRRIKKCFTAMLQLWINRTVVPTWGEVDDAMKKLVQKPDQTNHLWTQRDLEEINVTTEEDIPLPKILESKVLKKVMVLLVAVSITEISAVHSYLQPLDGHNSIYKYSKVVDQDVQQNKVIVYYIGKYGTWLAAIRNVPHGIEVDNNTLIMADQCFPNISVTISVGVACGIKKKVKLCDVLVSSKIVDHYKIRDTQEAVIVSPQLVKLFTQHKQWLNDSIRKRLNYNKISTPNVKSGVILNGPYHLEDNVTKTSLDINMVPEAIGVEVEQTHVFPDIQQSTLNVIVVKTVCDFFGDGKYHKLYQPTAALIAADLVYRCLNDPQDYQVFKGQTIMRQMLQQAKNEGLTINVRHAKILFCGASCAGKTSFSRLLKNQKHETVYRSTSTGDSQQVLISGKVNVEDTNWINLDSELETQELMRRLKTKLQNHTDIDPSSSNDNSSVEFGIPKIDNEQHIIYDTAQSNKETVAVTAHSDNITGIADLELKEKIKISKGLDPTNDQLSSTTTSELLSKPVGIEEQMVTYTDKVSENLPKIWDLFTLLDTGGQPEFINMLPAINASTAITFVVFNMSSGKQCLDDSVLAQYNYEGYNYTNCSLKYTNLHLLKCLLSSVEVASMKKYNFQPAVIKKITEGQQALPIVCVIGTCADVLKKKLGKKYNEEMSEINKEIKKLVETMKKKEVLTFWCDAEGNYVIPIDNTIPRNLPNGKTNRMFKSQLIQNQTALTVKKIRENSNELLKTKAQYEIPISWFILEVELRRISKVCIPLAEVQDICDRIMPSHRKMKIEEIKEVLNFYHLYGMLLYFSEVDGMKDFVITNPQWLFINLSKIIMCRFEVDANDLYGDYYIKNMYNGICYMELLRRIKLKLQGIELESFIKLLVHLKIIAPMMDGGYFMPTILPPCSQNFTFTEKEYGKPAAFAPNGECIHQEVEPLLIEFFFGTIPRGLFGFLIVQLLQDNPETFELYGENDKILRRCTDLVSFYMKPCFYISLCDRISYLELQVRVKGNEPSCHYKVQLAVTEAFKKVCDKFSWKFSDCRFGFLCLEHAEDYQSDHLTVLSTTEPIPNIIPKYASCKNQQPMHLTEAHKIWFEESRRMLRLSTEGNNKPTIKLLMNYEGKIAPRWYALGMQLLEEKYVHQIYIIQKNYPTDIRKCCAKMFQYWLEVDTGASWDKLIKALEKIEQISLAEDIKKEYTPSVRTQQQLPEQQQEEQQSSISQQPQLQQEQLPQQPLISQHPQVQRSQDTRLFSDKDESVPLAATIGLPAYALYDFIAKGPEELSLKANEFIMVMEDLGNGWLKVNRHFDLGYVPSAYVQLLHC